MGIFGPSMSSLKGQRPKISAPVYLISIGHAWCLAEARDARVPRLSWVRLRDSRLTDKLLAIEGH